ncbi:MAG: hypothetical protein M3296_06450 [Actinomycetota bacterium]|nr:hypothetical protein [Actinomycetota bacterium]
MHALPFVFALLAAVALAPPLRRGLRQAGATRENFRGRSLPFPFGLLVVASAFVALVPVALLARLAGVDIYPDDIVRVMLFVPGVALLGLADDALTTGAAPSGGSPRGLRGHGAAVLGGGFSTGALKAAGTVGLALLVASDLPGSDAEFLLAAAVLVLATNLFNQLDLRPGRSVKVFVLLGIGLIVFSADLGPLASLGVFVAPVLVAGFYDLREEVMLGDTGSNAIGALAGLWLVFTLGTTGQIVALVVLGALTAYGELRSITALVERIALLRRLDSLGRPR